MKKIADTDKSKKFREVVVINLLLMINWMELQNNLSHRFLITDTAAQFYVFLKKI